MKHEEVISRLKALRLEKHKELIEHLENPKFGSYYKKVNRLPYYKIKDHITEIESLEYAISIVREISK